MLANVNDRPRANPYREGRVDLVGNIVVLCLTAFAAIMFNLFPGYIGFVDTALEPRRFTPLLAREFWVHLPMLNFYWLLVCNVCILNLAMPYWRAFRHWADASLQVLGVFILLQLVIGGPLTLYPQLDTVLKLGMGMAAIPAAIGALGAVRRVVSRALEA